MQVFCPHGCPPVPLPCPCRAPPMPLPCPCRAPAVLSGRVCSCTPAQSEAEPSLTHTPNPILLGVLHLCLQTRGGDFPVRRWGAAPSSTSCERVQVGLSDRGRVTAGVAVTATTVPSR